jgi:hypothetical protein
MQLAKQLFFKLKQKFIKNKKSQHSQSYQCLLANREEFIYDDHISLYSFNDHEQVVKMFQKNDIDNIISFYTN